MSSELAERIYTILVTHLDARESNRRNFVYQMTAADCREWRFQGCLGFGGKLYNDHSLRVDCYPEDRTPGRQAKIEAVNQMLLELSASSPPPDTRREGERT